MSPYHASNFFVLVLSAFRMVASQSTTSFFVVPPDLGANKLFATNQNYTIGDQLDVQWVTDKETYSIVLWQQSLTVDSALTGQAVYSKVAGSPETGNFTWTVDPQTFDVDQSNVFFFAAGPLTLVIDENSFTSHYFNLTRATDGTTASATGTPTASTPPTLNSTSLQSSPTSSVIANPASTAKASSTPGPESGLDSATKAGLGVGLGIGIPLLVVIVYLVFRKVRKAQKQKQLEDVRKNQPPPFEKPPTSRMEMPTTRSSTLPPLSHSYRNYMSGHDREDHLVELPVNDYRI